MTMGTDKLVFVEMQKTGSSFVNKMLRRCDLGAREEGFKHHRVSAEQLGDRLLLASCRNPWNWYVSVFNYACGGRGVLEKRLTKYRLERHGSGAPWYDTARYLAVQFIKPRQRFKELHADGSPEAFRQWVRRLHGRRGRWTVAERFAGSPLHRSIGLYSWRFLYLLARDEEDLYDRSLARPAGLQALLREGLFEHHLLRTESLATDLVAGLHRAGHVLSEADEATILESKPNNQSKRRREPYYDRETARLVYELDGALADRFGYQPPQGLEVGR